MKKKYVCPQIDIISTKMEDALLAGSPGDGHVPGHTGAKSYDGNLDDSVDEALWNDENRWK